MRKVNFNTPLFMLTKIFQLFFFNGVVHLYLYPESMAVFHADAVRAKSRIILAFFQDNFIENHWSAFVAVEIWQHEHPSLLQHFFCQQMQSGLSTAGTGGISGVCKVVLHSCAAISRHKSFSAFGTNAPAFTSVRHFVDAYQPTVFESKKQGDCFAVYSAHF